MGTGTRSTIQKRRQKAVARLREAATDVQRARIEALIASHDEALARHDGRLTRVGDESAAARDEADGLRTCSRCKVRLRPTEANFPPRGDRPGSLPAECRQCGRDRSAERYARKVLVDSGLVPKARPGPKPGPRTGGLVAEELARDEREREIRLLILRYEAVRSHPGPDRTAVYNTLGLALQRHGRPVSDGVREWSWARGMGEVTSRLIRREWRLPEDPHANPRRVARGDLVTMGTDLVEIGG